MYLELFLWSGMIIGIPGVMTVFPFDFCISLCETFRLQMCRINCLAPEITNIVGLSIQYRRHRQSQSPSASQLRTTFSFWPSHCHRLSTADRTSRNPEATLSVPVAAPVAPLSASQVAPSIVPAPLACAARASQPASQTRPRNHIPRPRPAAPASPSHPRPCRPRQTRPSRSTCPRCSAC